MREKRVKRKRAIEKRGLGIQVSRADKRPLECQIKRTSTAHNNESRRERKVAAKLSAASENGKSEATRDGEIRIKEH